MSIEQENEDWVSLEASLVVKMNKDNIKKIEVIYL